MEDQLINGDGGEIRTPNNKKKYIIFLVSFILIVGLVILLIVILSGKDGKEKKDDKPTCEPGYFLPDDDKECKPCSISNCKFCNGTKSNNTCYTCDKNYIPIFENNVIETCELDDQRCLIRDNKTNKCLNCVSKYYLVNGKCKPYSFMATYYSDNKDKEIQLIDGAYRFYIVGMYMNNTNIDIKTSYTFSSIGNHTIYFYLNISSMDSLQSMFYKVEKMISINFSPEFNTKNIKSMNNMFSSCISLKS